MKEKKNLKKPSAVRPSAKVESKKFHLAGIASIVLLGIMIYSNSFNCSFHLDDYWNIVDNLKIRNLADLNTIFSASPNRPLPLLSFALNYHFNGLDVWGWHLVNVAIHLANALLVRWLTLLIFSTPFMKAQKLAGYKYEIALVAALMFVSHPLATQSVTYIVQRMTSMAALFFLLSVSLYIFARITDRRASIKVLAFAGSFAAAICAMLSKENAFTLPFVIVLAEFFFIRQPNLKIDFRDYRVILLMAAFLAVILIIPFRYDFSIFNDLPPSRGRTYTLTPLNYLFTQFSVLIKYIQLLILPVNQMVDYDFPISNSFLEIRTVISFLVILCLLVLAILLFKRNRVISFGILWFFLTLSIESSIIPINDVIFEHRTYLPSVGYFLVLAFIIVHYLYEKHKYLVIALFGLMIAAYALMTYQRNKIWKDELSLWSDNVEKAPNFARPVYSRGGAFAALQDWDRAIADYSRAIELDPYFVDAYYNRGNTYAKQKKWRTAIDDYTRAIDMYPHYHESFFNRGFAYYNIREWDKAIVDYSKAIELNPGNSNAYYNRGLVFYELEEWERAIEDYTSALSMDPSNKEIFVNRGVAYYYQKEWNKAIEDYTSALNLDPNVKGVYVNRALAHGELGQWDKAVDDYNSALRLDPNFGFAIANRESTLKKLNK